MAEEAGEYILVTPDGNQLKSTWGYTGKGQTAYPNGEIYEGDYVDGKKSGTGSYQYANGNKYTGGFQNDLKEGIGRLNYHQEDEKKVKPEYYGYFRNGKRDGEGVFKFANGDIYSGQWKEGKKEGKGTYIVKESGVKMIGFWADGKIMKGKWVFPNGTYYEGQFDHNQPKGNGIWKFANGNVCSGEYLQTILPSEDEDRIDITLSWTSRR